MKHLILFLSFFLLSISLFSQRLEEKAVSELKANTLFAVQDSGQLYNWRKISFEALQGEFNTLRTPYGNVAGVDSTAILQGVSFYKDSTVFNNTLIGKKAVFSPDIAITNGGLTLDADRYYLGGTYRGNDRGSLTIGKDYNNGIGLVGWVNPRPDKSGHNMFITAHANMSSDSANFVSNSPHRAMMNFVVIGDKWDTLTGDWLGNSKVTNAPLFGFHQYGSGYQMGIWNDSVKVYRDFVVGNSLPNQKKYFEVTNDNTKINNTLVANDGLKLSELSYTPTSSTDLQAEAAAAEVGTMWQLNISGSWYLVTKISATTLARTAFSEW